MEYTPFDNKRDDAEKIQGVSGQEQRDAERVGATDEERNKSEGRGEKNGQLNEEANKVGRSENRLQLQTIHTSRENLGSKMWHF